MRPGTLPACALALITLLAAGCPASSGSDLVPTVGADTDAAEARLQAALQSQGATADLYAELAAVRMKAGQTAAARAYVRRALLLDSRHVGALVVGARVELARKQPEAALDLYAKAHDANPRVAGVIEDEWSETLLTVARARVERGYLRGAVDAVTTMEKRLPDRSQAIRSQRAGIYLDVADRWLDQGRPEPAREAIQAARAAGASNDELQLHEAKLKVLAGEDDAGRAAFEAWANGGDTAPARWERVGRFYMARSRPDDAQWAYRKATESRDDADLLESLGRTSLKAQDPEGAVAAFKRAAATRGGAAKPADRARVEAEALVDGARRVWKEGYRAYGLKLMYEAMDKAPASWDVVGQLGDYLIQVGHQSGGGAWPKLRKVVDRYVKATGSTPEATLRGAKLLAKSSQVTAAIELLDGLIGAPGAPVDLWLELARLRDMQADATSRDRALERYIQAAGGTPEVLVRAGRAWLRYKKADRALALAEQARKADPKSVAAGLLLADVHRDRGEDAKEHEVLQKLLETSGGSGAAALEIGRRYKEMQDRKRAVRYLEKALESSDAAIERAAHRELFDLYLSGTAADHGMAATHMRAWLALVPEDERGDALATLQNRTLGIKALVSLRIEVLQQRSKLQPNDTAILEALGREYLNEDRFARAVEAFEKAVAVAPSRVEAAQEYGDLLLRKGRPDDALVFFSLIEPEQITRKSLHADLGSHYDRRGDTERAERHYRLFLQYASSSKAGNATEIKNFAEAMTRARRYGLAIEAYQTVLARDARDRQALLGLGRAHLRRGDRPQARALLERFLESRTGSDRLNALEQVARLFREEGALEDAARLYEERLSYDRPTSGNSRYYNMLSETYRKLGDRKGMVRAAQLMIRRSGNLRAYTTVARQLELAGMWDEAYKVLSDGLTRAANRRSQRRSLLDAAADNALQRGDVATARAHLEELIQIKGGSPHDWRRAAETLDQFGYTEAAVELLDRAAARNGGAPAEIYFARGRLRLALGRIEQAHADFIEAMTRSLTPTDMLEAIDKVYRQAGQLDRLRELQGRALALSPARSDHYLQLGRSHLAAGRFEEARQAFRRYLSVGDRGHLKVARAYSDAGLMSKALEHYERSYDQPGAREALSALTAAAQLIAQVAPPQLFERHARRYLMAMGSDPRAFDEVARIWRDVIGDPERALAWTRRAWEANPEPKHHFEMARLLDVLGRREESLQQMDLYLAGVMAHEPRRGRAGAKPRSRPEVAKAATDIVEFYADGGRYDEALERVRAIARAWTVNAWTVVHEAEFLVLSGRVADGLALLQGHDGQVGHARAADLLELALALAVRDRVDEALQVLERAESAGPSEGVAKLKLALLARRGQVDLARQSAAEMVVGGEALQYARVGSVLFDEGLWELAEHHLRQALLIARGKNVEQAALELATILRSRPRATPDAHIREVLTLATRDTEDRVLAYELESLLRFEEGDYRGARAAADRALELEPSNEPVWERSLRASVLLGDVAGLWQRIDRYVSLSSTRRKQLSKVVGWMEEMGQPRLALQATERLLELDRGDRKLRARAIRLAAIAGDAEAVTRHGEAYVKLAGSDPGAPIDVADLLDAHLYPELATAWLARASARGPLTKARRKRVEGRVALHEGNAAAAAAALEASIATAPDRTLARLTAARDVLRAGAPGELAAKLLSPLLEGDEPTPAALMLGAIASWRAGRVERARELSGKWIAATAARALSSESAFDFADLLEAAVSAGDVEGARTVADTLVRLDPKQSVVGAATAIGHGASMLRATDPDAAAALASLAERYLEAGAENSGVYESWVNSAWQSIAEARGDEEAALTAYEAALARSPHHPTLANNYAYALAVFGKDLERALSLVRQAMAQKAEGVSNYLDTEAWVLYRLGRPQEALAVIHRAVGLASQGRGGLAFVRSAGMCEMLFHKGEIELAVGRRAPAIQTFRDCARRAPTSEYGGRCLARFRELTTPR